MPSVFDSKIWNSKVFNKYLETIPRVKQNALIKAGIFRVRNDLKSRLVDQVGGNYITEPIVGRIGGDVQNYDGNTNIITTGLKTFSRSMVVAGRAKAWREYDFTEDITGKNFMEEIAKQVADYWDDVDEQDVISTLHGIFGVSSSNFASDHTLDLTSESQAADQVVKADSLNNAIQKASGANKNQFTLVIMHSQVATNLENMELLKYRLYTDSDGVQRQLNLADWNGRTVLVDDDLVSVTYTGAGVYTITVGGTVASGDKITVNGVTLTLDSTSGADATAAATALKSALEADATFNATYSMTRSTSTLTVTEKSSHYGAGRPVCSIESTAGTIAAATTTEPTSTNKYETFVLGRSCIDYCDCGAKTPSETWRDPHTNGGLEELITRQRKLYAPYGFSFTNSGLISPTAANLATAANWDLAQDSESSEYFPTKVIPIARILSYG